MWSDYASRAGGFFKTNHGDHRGHREKHGEQDLAESLDDSAGHGASSNVPQLLTFSRRILKAQFALLAAVVAITIWHHDWWLLTSVPLIYLGWACSAPNLNLVDGCLPQLIVIIDSVSGRRGQTLYRRLDAYAPWNVGNYSTDSSGIKHAPMAMWAQDKKEYEHDGPL
jgi:hypothetical protein